MHSWSVPGESDQKAKKCMGEIGGDVDVNPELEIIKASQEVVQEQLDSKSADVVALRHSNNEDVIHLRPISLGDVLKSEMEYTRRLMEG